MKKYIKLEDFLSNNTNDKVKKTKLSNIIFYTCITLFSCIIIFSLYTIFKWTLDNTKIGQINAEIDKNVNLRQSIKEGILFNPEKNRNSIYWYYAKIPFYEVDFSILKEKNNDTIGYIHMRNTNINYPIVQSYDNKYYLTHDFNKEKNGAGWIFMDYRNDINNLSDNNIIYGHGRLDKKLFGSLKNVLSNSYQKNKDNLVIFISTPKKNLIFEIFSIYIIKEESYYITTKFVNKKSKVEWLKEMKRRNISSINVPVNDKDIILTLSTCKNNDGDRIVVQSKLVKKEIRKNQ